jgi:predicted acyltransferase
MSAGNNRIQSIDALRGLDMVLLSGGAAVLWQLCRLVWGNDVPSWLGRQFVHAEWGCGFTCWDLVMPLFLFITGCSMPFAFARYREQGRVETMWRVLRRVVLLFVLGMVVQGNLCSGEPAQMSLFCNTLQAIACGYLISALVLLCWGWRGQLVCCVVLLGIYWALLRFVPYGDQPAGLFQPRNNLAYFIDCTLQGRWQDGTPYTWILTSLNFGALTLMGTLAGGVLSRLKGLRACLLLAGAGVLCLGAALLLELDTPLIKHLFTSTMVLWSGGWCLLLLAVFHLVFDLLPATGWLAFPLRVVGCNALLAYLLTNTPGVGGRSIWGNVAYSLFRWADNPLLYECLSYGTLWLMLYWLYRYRAYLRV